MINRAEKNAGRKETEEIKNARYIFIIQSVCVIISMSLTAINQELSSRVV